MITALKEFSNSATNTNATRYAKHSIYPICASCCPPCSAMLQTTVRHDYLIYLLILNRCLSVSLSQMVLSLREALSYLHLTQHIPSWSMHLPILTQIETALHKNCFSASPTTYSSGFWKKIRHQRELTMKDNSCFRQPKVRLGQLILSLAHGDMPHPGPGLLIVT